MANSKNDNSNSERMNDKREQDQANDGKQEKEQGQNNTQDQNKKWDQAQRRHQASPRGYSENTDSQNTENQNTLAKEEQIDQPGHKEDPNDPKKIGDQISQRQQTIDEDDAPENKKDNSN